MSLLLEVVFLSYLIFALPLARTRLANCCSHFTCLCPLLSSNMFIRVEAPPEALHLQ